jgi:hypothetical protein
MCKEIPKAHHHIHNLIVKTLNLEDRLEIEDLPTIYDIDNLQIGNELPTRRIIEGATASTGTSLELGCYIYRAKE